MNEVHFPPELGCRPLGEPVVREDNGLSILRYYFLRKDLNGSLPLLYLVGRVREGLRPQDLQPQIEVEVRPGWPTEIFIG